MAEAEKKKMESEMVLAGVTDNTMLIMKLLDKMDAFDKKIDNIHEDLNFIVQKMNRAENRLNEFIGKEENVRGERKIPYPQFPF